MENGLGSPTADRRTSTRPAESRTESPGVGQGEWLSTIARVCEEAARGNLEVRLLGCPEGGDVARVVRSINHLLDITDAFVREAKASLDYASHGKFFRRVILRGLPGTFRQAATLINAASHKMEAQAAELRLAERRRIELADEFERNIQDMVTTVASAATEMWATARGMVETAGSTTEQAATVAAAAEQTSVSVQAVASAAEQLSASASEIGRRLNDSTKAARAAVAEVEHTNAAMHSLVRASEQIGGVVKLISDVANQTKLLSLNATIEAVRAGDVGKGFAVVASEVKSLAQQTSRSTDDITKHIEAMQLATGRGVDAIDGVGRTIHQFDEISGGIATSVGEQHSAIREISSNVHQAATGTRQVSDHMTGVSRATKETSEAAKALLDTAGDLSRHAESLLEATRSFVGAVRGK